MNHNLLLLHGALGTKDQFSSLQEKLSSHFQVHSIDFEGHGNVPSSNDFSIDLFTNNVFDYLIDNKIESTHIFGYSMGGYVGLNLALTQPGLVGKIVTLGTKFAWSKETAEKEIKMLNPEKIEEKVPAFANKLASIHSANDWKTVVHQTAKMMYKLGNGKKLTNNDLKQIEHPALIGIGSNDRMVSIEESKASADALPNGTLNIIEGFPHPIEKVNEDQLTSIIVEFIS